LITENVILEGYIRAYNSYIADKGIFYDKRTVPEKIKNALKEITYYGTEIVSKAYTLFT